MTQHKCTAALNSVPTVQCCSVKQPHSRKVVTAVTPVEICSSYRCLVPHYKCTAALFRAKSNPHCPVLLCKTGSQKAVCQCSYTCGDLLFIQVSSDPAQMHCRSVQGKIQALLFIAALQNSLTQGKVTLQSHLWRFASCICAVTQHKCSAAHCSALLCKTASQQARCHCSYTCGDLLLIQVCSDATPVHCSTGQGKMAFPLFSAALLKQADSSLVSLQMHLWTFANPTAVQ